MPESGRLISQTFRVSHVGETFRSQVAQSTPAQSLWSKGKTVPFVPPAIKKENAFWSSGVWKQLTFHLKIFPYNDLSIFGFMNFIWWERHIQIEAQVNTSTKSYLYRQPKFHVTYLWCTGGSPLIFMASWGGDDINGWRKKGLFQSLVSRSIWLLTLFLRVAPGDSMWGELFSFPGVVTH
jgi:hypothetical protein